MNASSLITAVSAMLRLGAHIISGNVFEPRALNELLPQWKEQEVRSVFFFFCA